MLMEIRWVVVISLFRVLFMRKKVPYSRFVTSVFVVVFIVELVCGCLLLPHATATVTATAAVTADSTATATATAADIVVLI